MSQFDHTAYLEDVATGVGKHVKDIKSLEFSVIPFQMGNHIESIEIFISRGGKFLVIRTLCL